MGELTGATTPGATAGRELAFRSESVTAFPAVRAAMVSVIALPLLFASE